MDGNPDTYLAHLRTPLTNRVDALEKIIQLEENNNLVELTIKHNQHQVEKKDIKKGPKEGKDQKRDGRTPQIHLK